VEKTHGKKKFFGVRNACRDRRRQSNMVEAHRRKGKGSAGTYLRQHWAPRVREARSQHWGGNFRKKGSFQGVGEEKRNPKTKPEHLKGPEGEGPSH